jgi:hypothetical protein
MQLQWGSIGSFSGEGSRREPPTTGKQLVNFITCCCESTALYLAHLAKGNVSFWPVVAMFVNGSELN